MPIEREFKYVLRDVGDIWNRLVPTIDSNLISGYAEINQAYLGKGGRIRSKTWYNVKGVKLATPKVEKIFTYKLDLTTRPGCLELEQAMSDEDFDLAMRESSRRLRKHRFVLPCHNSSAVWEIDIFFDDLGIYFAMAEYEEINGEGRPTVLHPLVKEYLLYSVPEGDDRFKNSKLGDRVAVEKLTKEILKEIA